MSINLKVHSISESNNPKMYPTSEQMAQQHKIDWLINELAKEMDKLNLEIKITFKRKNNEQNKTNKNTNDLA